MDEIRLDGGWVDLISSAKQISSAIADFILASARISFSVRVRIHTLKRQKHLFCSPYNAYQRAKGILAKTGKKAHSGSFKIADGVDVTKFDSRQAASAKLAAELSAALGVDIVLYQDSNPRRFGYYSASADAIFLNVNARWGETVNAKFGEGGASMMAFTLSHELVHRAKVGSPLKFRSFAQFLIREYNKAGVSVDALVAQQIDAAEKAGVPISEDKAFEEVVCDACQRMLTDTDAGKKLAQWGSRSKSNSEFLQTVRDILTELLDNLRRLFQDVTNDTLEARAFQKLDKNVQQILADMFVDMSTDAAEKLSTIKAAGMLDKINTTGEGGVMYSISKTSKMPYVNQLELIEKGKMNGSNSLYIGKPLDKLQSAGFSDAPLAMNQGDYRKARRKSAKNKKYSSHAVPYDFFKKMPHHIGNAPMLIDNGTKVSVVTPYGMKDTKGNDSFVIAGVWRNQQMESDVVNLVKSAYPLDDFNDRIKRAAEEGKLVIVNKNKAEEMLATIGIQPAEVSRILNLAKGSLSQPEADVKKISTTDSDGNQLTAGQQAYFAESEAVDKNGNLLSLYHQTAEDITEFDPRHPGAGRSDYETPFGIFLKRTDKDIGLKGKKQMRLYANAKNPLRAENREELVRKLRDISHEYAAVCDEIAEMNRAYKKRVDDAGQKLNDYMIVWRQNNPDASRRAIYDDATYNELSDAEDALIDEWVAKDDNLSSKAKEIITAALIDAGYDSVFLAKDTGSFDRESDAIIVLNPNQVKSVDNKNPTGNPDIRYKVSAGDDSQKNNFVDSSVSSEDNGVTNNSIRSDRSDNRGVREGATQSAKAARLYRGTDTANGSESHQREKWRNRSKAVYAKARQTVEEHIANSSNSDEVYYYLLNSLNIADSDMTTELYDEAVANLAEEIYNDAVSMHPVLFENKWAIMGGDISSLRSRLLENNSDSSNKISGSEDLSNAAILSRVSGENLTPGQKHNLQVYRERLAKVEEQLQQNTFAASARTAKQNVGHFHKIHSDRPGKTLTQSQYEGLMGKVLVIPVYHLRKIRSGGNSIEKNTTLPRPIFHLDNEFISNIKFSSFLIDIWDHFVYTDRASKYSV